MNPEFKESMENIGLQVKYLDSNKSQTKWLTESQELTKAIQETGIIDLINSQKQ